MVASHTEVCLCLPSRVLTDHHPPDEGARPPGLRKGDPRSFPNTEGEKQLFDADQGADADSPT